MNSQKVVSTVCLCVGIAFFIFGIIGATGALSFIEPRRVWLILFFGAIIIVWNYKSLKKELAREAMAADEELAREREAEAAGALDVITEAVSEVSDRPKAGADDEQ